MLQELWDLTQVRQPPPTVQSAFKKHKYDSL